MNRLSLDVDTVEAILYVAVRARTALTYAGVLNARLRLLPPEDAGVDRGARRCRCGGAGRAAGAFVSGRVIDPARDRSRGRQVL